MSIIKLKRRTKGARGAIKRGFGLRIACLCLSVGGANAAETDRLRTVDAAARAVPAPEEEHSVYTLTPDMTTEQMNAVIVTAIQKNAAGVTLEPNAVYDLKAVPGASIGGAAAALLIRKARNFALDCQGSTLVLNGSDKSSYGDILRMEYDEGITLRNCDFDYAQLPFTQAVLTSVGSDGAVFRVDPALPIAWSSVQRISQFDPTSKAWLATNLEWSNSEAGSRALTSLGEGSYQVSLRGKDKAALDSLIVGGSYLLENQVYGANAVSWYSVKGLTFDHTRVFAAAGQGFKGQVSSDVRFTSGSGVRIRPDTTRVQSTNADGVNIANQRGVFTVNDGVFEGSQDDAINVYGTQTTIKALADSTHLTLAGKPTAWSVGDMLEFIDAAGAVRGTAIVGALAFDSNTTDVTLASPPPSGAEPAWIVADQTDSPTLFSVNGTTFQKLRGRGVVANAQKIDVTANHFSDLPSNGAMTFYSDYSYFAQGPMPKHISIVGNSLERVNTRGGDPGAISIYAFSKDGKTTAPAGQIADVSIKDNHFRETRNMCVYVAGADNVHIVGNTAAEWATSSNRASFRGLANFCYGIDNVSSGEIGPNTYLTTNGGRAAAVGASSVDLAPDLQRKRSPAKNSSTR